VLGDLLAPVPHEADVRPVVGELIRDREIREPARGDSVLAQERVDQLR
jgi:hypothetical protein